MFDTVKQKTVQVRAHGQAPPHVAVPYQKLPELERVLTDAQITYEVDEETISIDGKPEVIYVTMKRGTDPSRLQQLLDSVP